MQSEGISNLNENAQKYDQARALIFSHQNFISLRLVVYVFLQERVSSKKISGER